MSHEVLKHLVEYEEFYGFNNNLYIVLLKCLLSYSIVKYMHMNINKKPERSQVVTEPADYKTNRVYLGTSITSIQMH